MTTQHDNLMKLTKNELVTRLIAAERSPAHPAATPRTLRLVSPAGPVHHLTGFVDGGAGDITLAGLPEDEFGHWPPYYTATANGMPLALKRIVVGGEGNDDGDA